MSNEEKRLQLLLRHIQHVNDNCKTIAEFLIANNEFYDAKELLRNGHIHDASKFSGIEWDHLGSCSDPLFKDAIRHHVTTNPHHPEYWGGIHNMPRIYIAELAADWHARSFELKGKGLIQWIEEDALKRFNFNYTDKVYNEVYNFINILLEPAFA